VVVEVVDVEDKMNFKECPLCEKELFSSIGRGCKMCGMALEEGYFCCEKCEIKWEKINNV